MTSVVSKTQKGRKPNNILAQAEAIRGHAPEGVAIPKTTDGYRTLTRPIVGSTDVREVVLSAIRSRHEGQIRSGDPALGDSFSELVASIKTRGVLQPVTLSWDEKQQCFWVDVGHRRTAAARVAGLETIPAVIRKRRDAPHERTADLTADQLIENVHRLDLPALDVAYAVEALLQQGFTAASIARKVGKSEGWLSQHRKILQLDEQTLAEARKAGLGASVLYLIAQEKDLTVTERRELLEVAQKGRPELQKRLEEIRIRNREAPKITDAEPTGSRALKGAARRLMKSARHFETLLRATGEHDALLHSVRNLCDAVERELGI